MAVPTALLVVNGLGSGMLTFWFVAAVALMHFFVPPDNESFRLTGHSTFTIGRLAGLNVALPDDPYLSRLHCLIEFNPPTARLVDLESKSGTKVNGVRASKVGAPMRSCVAAAAAKQASASGQSPMVVDSRPR